MQMNNYLYLIWKDPQTRRNFVIGRLGRGEKYTFEYFGEFEKAKQYGWTKFDVFSEEKVYESNHLFPVFASRLPDKKRRDIDKILQKYGLSEFDEFELLRKSGAKLPIDTYSFIDPIFPNDEIIIRDFFIMGVRYQSFCKGDNCFSLPEVSVGDELFLKKEPNNLYDSNAIVILTQKMDVLGYVPRYYNLAIIERLENGSSYSCTVMEVNCNHNCSECIKVRLRMPKVM